MESEKITQGDGNPNFQAKAEQNKSPSALLAKAIIRPTKMLFLIPIVAILALYIALVYGYMYMLFTTFTYIFRAQYGFNSGAGGLAYLGVGKKRQTQAPKPEDHLPLVPVGAFLVRIGLFTYGRATYYQTHWIVPIIGTRFFGLGLLFAFLPVQLYFIDTLTIYSASAIATNTVLRLLFGAVLLPADRMYETLGLGWGNSLLGFVAVAFIPGPIILLKYGKEFDQVPGFR